MGRKERAEGLTWLDGTANTNTFCFDGDIFALQESTLPFEVSIADDSAITNLGSSDFDGLLDYGVSAHPHVDQRKQQLLWHGYATQVKDAPDYKFGIRSKGSATLDFYQPIELSRPSFNHDFAFTENYALILDQSIAFDFKKVLTGGSLLSFDKKHALRIGLLPRDAKGDETLWFEADRPIGIVHPFCAWEDGDDVIFWAPIFTDLHTGSTFELEPMPFEEPSRTKITEFRMNLKDPERRIHMHTLEGDYATVEFSKINNANYGYPTRYGYGGWQDFYGETRKPMGGTGFNFRGVLKVDFQERCIIGEITYPDGCVGGDPSYIPRVDASAEDDGWLCIIVYDTIRNSTSLHLYAADTLERTAVLAFPVRVPPGFHSNYITEVEMQEHLQKHGPSSKL